MMIQLGRLAILAWAVGICYVGFLLVKGQGGVALAALQAGRMSEALMQGIFITVVAITTVLCAGLFLVIGVIRE
jgi:hypothetical protein